MPYDVTTTQIFTRTCSQYSIIKEDKELVYLASLKINMDVDQQTPGARASSGMMLILFICTYTQLSEVSFCIVRVMLQSSQTVMVISGGRAGLVPYITQSSANFLWNCAFLFFLYEKRMPSLIILAHNWTTNVFVGLRLPFVYISVVILSQL